MAEKNTLCLNSHFSKWYARLLLRNPLSSPIHALFTKSCNHQAAISQFPIGYIPNSTKNIRNPEITNNPHFNVGCSQHFEARSLIPWGEDSAPPLPRRADAAVPAPNGPPATPRRGPSAWGSTGRGRKGLPGRCQRSHAAPVGPYQKQIQAWKIWQDLIWELNMCVFFGDVEGVERGSIR